MTAKTNSTREGDYAVKQGSLGVLASTVNNRVRIEFARPISYMELPREQALALANLIREKAESLPSVQ